MQAGEVYAGRYRVDGELGRGGMGVVYAAHDLTLERDVALKVMAVAMRPDPSAIARFEREARALAAVQHPGVVTVHDYGRSDGELFLVMQRIEGGDLDQRLSGHRRLTAQRTAALAQDVASALDALHRRALVHRDVKPSNILLQGDEQRPVLCDFGLAKPIGRGDGLTATGQTVGTVAYMAPEQLQGEPATVASDVYAFGCVLFHCLAGRPPFTGADAWEVAVGHSTQQVPDVRAFAPDLPPQVQPVLERCLAKDPSARWPSAGAAAQALAGALAAAGAHAGQGATSQLPVFALEPDPRPVDSSGPLRHLVAVCLAVVLLAGAGGAVLGFRSTDGGPPAPPEDPAASGLQGADGELAARLTEEYGECTPLERAAGQVARLNCDATPEGIASLHAIQWQDTQTMRDWFRRTFVAPGTYEKRKCADFAGGAGNKGKGHYSTRTGVGAIACYVNDNTHAVMLWQQDDAAVQFLGIRDDADSRALFAWWQQSRDTLLRPAQDAPGS